MKLPPRPLAFAAALGLAFVAACQTEGLRPPRGSEATTAAGEKAVANPKPMNGQAEFFSGTIQAEVMLAKSDAIWKTAPVSGSARPHAEGGGLTAGLGGSGHHGGARGTNGDGGARRGGKGPPEPADAKNRDGDRNPAVRPSDAPPVQLRLRLTNHGDAPADVEVLDFDSALGNFAVQPAKLTLPVGQTVEAEPMTSRLGVPAVEEIPITVRLRIGGRAGPTDLQLIRLRPQPEEPTGGK